jgi:hypothetical protein
MFVFFRVAIADAEMTNGRRATAPPTRAASGGGA